MNGNLDRHVTTNQITTNKTNAKVAKVKSARSLTANFVSRMVFLKAVILIGGPQKGTRFRPLSLGIPKPLFPISGIPLVQHHIEALARVKIVKGWCHFIFSFST